MAEAFTARGLAVTLVEQAPAVMPTVDVELGRLLGQELGRHRVQVVTDVTVKVHPDLDPADPPRPADQGRRPGPHMTASASERRVLFVCTHNAGRSIVAAALLNARQPPGVRADSAGTDPVDALNPTVVTALAERGISLAGVSPKPISTGLLATAALVVTMSRQANGPTLPPSAARHQHWQLGFPAEDMAAMRVFCEQVDQRVQALLADLQPPTR
jgi:arsenate reductase